MKKILFFLSTFLIYSTTFSQGEANWWYFGQNAGLNFPFGPPVAVLGGTLNTMEGVAAASTGAGNLMFYTDGMTVRNSIHAVMGNGNGLLGNASSTQSAIVVQRPGSTNEYFVFTAGLPPAGDYRYSVIDMNLNGGLGGVTGTKNVLLYGPCTERITAVKHCNNIDYWIITHHWGTNEFRVYLLTAAGVNPVPIVSAVGSVSTGSTANAIGYLKASHDGNKLAVATRYSTGGSPAQGFVELFDFNNTTGVVSNPLNMGIHPYAYGVEFSPDGSRLYTNQSQPCIIYQFNMCAGSPGAIVASKTQVGTSPNGWAGALQLGPDNKIYHARIFANSIASINNPNTLGVGCGYVDNTIMLPGGTQCLGGLPNFPASYFSIFPPTVSATINMNNCYEASFNFVTPPPSCTGSGTPQSVSWNFGDPGSGVNNFSNLNNPSHIFTGAGSFIVTLVVNYQCYSDSDTILVNIIPCGITTSVNNDTICAGSCGSITATTTGNAGPVTYVWTPNIGVGPGPHVVCPPNTTTYQVIATDSVGNKDTAFATVVVNPLPTTTTSVTNVSCFGGNNGTATANPSGTAPFSYLWNSNPIQTTQTATGLIAGNYIVTVTDSNGCVVSANVIISEPPLLTASINQFNNVSCFGFNDGSATVTSTGGTPNYSYSWNTVPVQTTQTATGMPPGNYVVTVTDANGCVATVNVTISEPPLLTASINQFNNVSCFGFNDGSATVTPAGGTPNYSYSWNTVPVQTTQTASGMSPGNYVVTVTDSNGCVVTANITITEPTAIVLNTSATPAICGQQIGTATVNASGGTGSYTYSWNSNPIQTTPTATSLATGSYTVTVTDSNGCVATANVFVPFSNSFSINSYIINHVSCYGGSNGAAGVNLNGGTSPFSYLWSSGGTSSTENNLPAGTYNIVVTDSAGCVDSAVIVITEPPALSVSINPNNIDACIGDSITLAAQATGGTGSYVYLWNPSSQTTASILFTASNSGQYSVTVTDANGCTDNAVAFITVNPLPIADFSVDTTNGCAPVCVNFLSVTTSDTYSWAFGDTGHNNGFMPYYCYTKPGTYSVTLMVTDSNGCKNSITKTNLITVFPVPVADFFPSPFRTDIYSPEIIFTNTSDGATTALWNFADGQSSSSYNTTHSYAEPGKYGVLLTVCNTFGCCDTITKFVKVDGSFTYFVPTAFTIDGDNINELFFAKGVGIDTERYLLQVFDRWGELIWETTDLNQGWNGVAKNGDLANSAVYVWKASVWEKDKNLHHNFIGHVTLLR
jgi:gliding motility-associated-like protein